MTLQGNVKNEINEQLRALQTTDSAHPNTFNPLFQDLLDNDVTLDKKIDDTKQEIEGVKEYVDDKAEITYNEAKAYTDSLVSSITETGVASLGQYSYTLTATTNGQLDFEIPLTIFDKNVDSLSIVALNRQYLGVEDYEITDNITEGRTLTLKVDPSEVTVGSTINLLILKNVPVGANGTFSGAHLQNDTVTKSKLEPSLRTDIEKIPTIENQLTTGQSETVVLNRGDNIIEAELDSIVKAINFEPQTIVNHVPLFDIGFIDSNFVYKATYVVDSPTKITITPTESGSYIASKRITIKPSTRYTISYKGNTTNKKISIWFYNSAGTLISDSSFELTSSNVGTFTTPSETVTCRVVLRSTNVQQVSFEELSLVEGEEQKPFVANIKGTTNPSIINKTNNTYLTLLSTVHKGDEVFVDTDGKLKVRRKWKEIELTGDEDWSIHNNHSDYKSVKCPAPKNVVGIGGDFRATGVKFNGLIIRPRGTISFGTDVIVMTQDYMYVTISNADSGWGQNYSPTKEEIQAYFKGWKMYKRYEASLPPYNGEGEKAWVYVNSVNGDGSVVTVPTSQAPITESWQPYRLIYELETPLVETIQTVGNLRLEEGTNELELTEGIIRREVIIGRSIDGGISYYINNTNPSSYNPFKYKLDYHLAVYKNGEIDNSWIIDDDSDKKGYQYGNYRLYTKHYDPTAVYTVDYIPLEPYKVTAPIKTLTIEYTSSLGSVVEKLVEESSEQENRISVIEQDMVRKGEGVQIIKPLLYAPFKYVSENDVFNGYFKNSLGMVYGNLFIEINNEDEISANSGVFTLPKGFRPSKILMFVGMAYTGATTGNPILISINPYGTVQLANAYAVGKKTFVISFSFKAEQ